MLNAHRLVEQLNASAVSAGTARSIAQFENVGTHAQYRLPYEQASRYVTRNSRVLDWGCGNGHFSLLLAALGAEVTGYSFDDPPTCMAGSARFRHVRGNVADPRTIPFEAGTFDVVCSVGVLEHVWETGGDERDSLAEIHRVLAPNGIFLTFHLPNRSGWVEKVVKLARLKKHFHLRKYDAREIRSLWDDAGFDVVDIGRYNALPRAELSGLPAAVRHSRAFVQLYNAADDGLRAAVPSVCTNFFVVGKKR